MPVVEDPEASVRQYLLFVDDPNQLVDTSRLEELTAAVEASTDPIDRLKALAQLEKAQQPTEAVFKEAFVRAAKAWAEANAIPASAFLSMGVDPAVLQAAGILPAERRTSRGRGRSAGAPPRITTSKQIKQSILERTGQFTLADIASSVGGSPMTIRKAVGELVDTGSLERLGPDPAWSNQGRAPILFRRR